MADFSTLPPHLQAAYARDPRRGQAQFMQERSFNRGDIKHPLQGLAQMLMAYKSGQKTKGLEEEFAGRGQAYNEALGRALGMIQPGTEEIPAAGPPTAMGEFPTVTRDVPANYAGAAQEMAKVGGPLATQFAIAGAGRTQGLMDTKAKQEWQAAQDKIAFERAKELKGVGPEKERKIIKGMDGRNYYADTGEPVLKDMKTGLERLEEMLAEPPETAPEQTPDITGELDASVAAPNQYAALDDSGIDFTGGEPVDIAPPQMLAGLDTFDGAAEPDVAPSVETPTAKPTPRELFYALPQEVQTGIMMAQDPIKKFSEQLLQRKGIELTTNPDGTFTFTQGGAAGDLQKSTRGQMEKDILMGQKSIDAANYVEALYEPPFLSYGGMAKAAYSTFLNKLDHDTRDQFTQRRAAWLGQTNQSFIAYRKWATGVAGGEKEMAEIKRATFSEDDSPQDFEAKLASIKQMSRKLVMRLSHGLEQGIKPGDKGWKKFMEDNPLEGFVTIQDRGDELLKLGYKPEQVDLILENEGYK